MTEVLKVSNLSYRYPGCADHILKGINLEIKKGDAVAIVGLSGVVKELEGYHPGASVEVKIGEMFL